MSNSINSLYLLSRFSKIKTMISSILFAILVISGVSLFTFNVKKISRNIKKGKSITINDNIKERIKTMFWVAIGQSKMVKKPIAGILHFVVYVGFIFVNIELIEILLDGVLHEHRILAPIFGKLYNVLIAGFEIFAFMVTIACIIFLIRRNIIRLKRFHKPEMKIWPRSDANIILLFEIFLMSAFLFMNASDSILQTRGVDHYISAGLFPISNFLVPLISNLSDGSLIFLERFTWWFHIIGIFGFLNYVPYSKHFHILLAFPNVYYSKLKPLGYMDNMASVTKEIKLMMDPNADPYAAAPEGENTEQNKFGALDVSDLTWKALMDAYSCTECGRCTEVCPANITGKKLSPRKIIMDTRDRLERSSEDPSQDEKNLLNDFILKEEVWACTTCNACTSVCPVNIDHVSIIMDLRRYLVLEEASATSSLNAMFTNIENNGAPWQYPALDRAKWTEEIFITDNR